MELLTRMPKTDKVGDTRTVTKFAWFPRWVENKLIWLQDYESQQVFKHIHIPEYYSGNSWVEYDRNLILG